MKNNKISKIFLMLILIFAVTIGVTIVYGASSVSLSLPDAEAYKSYEYKIEYGSVGLNEDETYTFKRYSGIWPAGINVTSDGRIVGVPETSSYYKTMKVLAVSTTNPSDKKIIQCRLSIKSRKINVNVIGGVFPYDGSPHTASVTVTDAVTGEEIENIVPTIQYGSDASLTSVTDVGEYGLSVIPPKGCIIENYTGNAYIKINALPPVDITIDNASFPYDGEEHGIPDENVHIPSTYTSTYTVMYKRSYESDAMYSEDKPISKGTYTVRVQTTDRNYSISSAYATIQIYAEGIDFTVTNNNVPYNTMEQEPTVKPSNSDVGFTVSYTDEEGNKLTGKPTNAGKYTINIELNNPEAYDMGEISDNTFTITALPVLFTAENTSWTYEQNTSRKLDIITTPLIDKQFYDVEYKKQTSNQAVNEPLEEMSDASVYDVIITLNSKNYVKADDSVSLAEIIPKTVNFTVSPSEYTYNDTTFNPTVTRDLAENIGGRQVQFESSLGVRKVNMRNADTFNVIVTLMNDNYRVGTVTPSTVTVHPAEVKFTAAESVLEFTGSEQTPEITPEQAIDRSLYTITYTKQGGDGTVLNGVNEPGIYDVHIDFVKAENTGKSNYVLTDDSVKTIEVQTRTVDVNITANACTYGDNSELAFATPSEAVTLTYKQGDNVITDPTEAGTYDIVVTANEGYTLGNITGDTQAVIKPKPVKFTAEHTLFLYDAGTAEYNPNVTSAELPGDITYTVSYKKHGDTETVNKITRVGVYDAVVSINSGNYIPEEPLPVITVTDSDTVDVTITGGPFTYNGAVQTPLVEPSDAVAAVYKDAGGNEVTPVNAGEYTIELTAINGFKIGNITGDTHFAIKPAEISFNAAPSAFVYDDTEQEATVSSNNLPVGMTYTVQYRDNGGNLTDKVRAAGDYDIVINLEGAGLILSNYSVKVTPDKVSVLDADGEVTVTGGEFTYDGKPHYAEVSPLNGVSVTYKLGEDYVTDPTDAGVYTIIVTSSVNGYNPVITGDTTLTIHKKNVGFTVLDTSHSYDGAEHNVTVIPDSDMVTKDMYIVTYTKNGQPVNETKSVGIYNFTVEKTALWNKNLELTPCTGTMTITNYSMSYGNSPAAMIFKDDSKTDEQKTEAFEYFKEHHKFNDTNCPAGCIANVEYGAVYGIDFDADVYTVIVNNINNYTDAGIIKDGQPVTDYIEAREQVNNDERLYKITYTLGSGDTQEELVRYVVVINKTGDTNSDGNVNAVDANYLEAYAGWTDGKSRAINNISDARIWDVSHNSFIDLEDADAIRSRFKNKIVPYYPWIIKQ